MEISALSLRMAKKNIKTTLVFQGGGAKGIYHVGALRAIERATDDTNYPNFVIDGVAGTSIGALIASLIAVGYKSDELIDDDGRFPICRDHDVKLPQGLVGPRGWVYIKFARWIIRLLIGNDRWRERIFVSSIVALIVLNMIIYIQTGIVQFDYKYPLIAIVSLIFLLPVLFLIMLRGITDFKIFIPILDKMLIQRFSADLPEEGRHEVKRSGLLFRHLAEKRRKLRIVATSVSEKNTIVFSEELTPNVRVAEAVAASMAIPFLVKPVRIDNCDYVDGGLVSNVPAWTFDSERTIDPDSITIVMTIQRARPQGRLIKKFNFRSLSYNISVFRHLIAAPLVGVRHLEIKKSERLFVFPLKPIKVGMLDLDLKRPKIISALNEGREAVSAYLDVNFYSSPNYYGVIFDNILEHFQFMYKLFEGDGMKAGAEAHVRVALAQRMHPHNALKAKLSSDRRTDKKRFISDRIIYPADSFVATNANRRSHALQTEKPLRLEFSNRRDRFRRALCWTDRKWCLVVPVHSDLCDDPYDDLPTVIVEGDRPIHEFGLPTNTDLSEWRATLSLIGTMGSAILKERELRSRQP